MSFGYKTEAYRKFEETWKAGQEIAQELSDDLYARRQKNALTETEELSYINQAFNRFEAETEKTMSLDEVKSLVSGLMSVGVDTTGGVLSWRLLHLALCQETQGPRPSRVDGRHEKVQHQQIVDFPSASHTKRRRGCTLPFENPIDSPMWP